MDTTCLVFLGSVDVAQMAEVLVWGCNVADSWILLRMFLDSFQKVNGKNLALIPGRARLSCCIMPLPLPFVEHMTC